MVMVTCLPSGKKIIFYPESTPFELRAKVRSIFRCMFVEILWKAIMHVFIISIDRWLPFAWDALYSFLQYLHLSHRHPTSWIICVSYLVKCIQILQIQNTILIDHFFIREYIIAKGVSSKLPEARHIMDGSKLCFEILPDQLWQPEPLRVSFISIYGQEC